MSIPEEDRPLVRAARDIRERLIEIRLAALDEPQPYTLMLANQLDGIRSCLRGREICRRRGWPGAAARVAGRLRKIAAEVPYALSRIEEVMARPSVPVPPPRDLLAELRQVREEFGEVHYDAKARALSVTTDPIELEGVHLGEFEIVLEVAGPGAGRRSLAGRIVALDPNPATSNRSVTHPHVSDERMCAGDADAAIQQALNCGRICDFFLLVRSVLETYNADSPFVALSEWTGQPCYDCGYTMNENEAYFCNGCQESFCDGCSMLCMRCEDTYCRGCTTHCCLCGDRFCGGCMTTCPDCGQALCTSCLENRECPCKEENQEKDHEECDNTTADEVATCDTDDQRDGGLDVLREAARATTSSVGIDAA